MDSLFPQQLLVLKIRMGFVKRYTSVLWYHFPLVNVFDLTVKVII